MSTNTNLSKAVETATPARKRKAHSEAKRSVVNPSSVSSAISAALKRRELRAKSTVGLYSLRVGKGSFGLPFCAVSDHFALLAQKQILPMSDCYKVGSICLLDGKVSSVVPAIVLDKGVTHE